MRETTPAPVRRVERPAPSTPAPRADRTLRVSARCHHDLDALALVVDRPKAKVVETLAAGGIRAYMAGVAAQAKETA